MGIFRLNFILPNPRLDKTQNSSKATFGNITCRLDVFDFFWVFNSAQSLKNQVAFLVVVSWKFGLTPLDKSIFTGLGFYIRPIVFVGIDIDMLNLFCQGQKMIFEFRCPFYSRNPRDFCRFGLGEFVSFPNGDMGVGFFDKHHFAESGVFGVRAKYHNRFFLVNSCEIKQVTVLFKWQGAVCTYGVDIVRIEYRNAIGFEMCHKALTVLCKNNRG